MPAMTQTRLHLEFRTLYRRVIETAQRVEVRPAPAIMVRQPVAPPIPADNGRANTGVGSDATVLQSPRGPRVGATGLAPGVVPSDLDIERLTEKVVRKIDDRILAYRERMGKVF